MGLIIERARANVSADLGVIEVPVEGVGKLRIALATGEEGERLHGAFVSMRDGYLGTAFTRVGASETPDIENDSRSREDLARWAGFGPAVAVPIGSGDVVRGVLLLTRRREEPSSLLKSQNL
ncbi:GAF domain-containing protein [Streptomyces clavifer]|uniref:hypothetical protein n=1 Tax=Streptomyces clavifer TaxID=68188 RepID=UPI00365AB9A3